MERQVDSEKWEVVQRLEKGFIRIPSEKSGRIEYFVFVNGALLHYYSDALQVLNGLDIQDKTETVDYAPDYNVEDLFY